MIFPVRGFGLPVRALQLADRILDIAGRAGAGNRLDYQEFYVSARGIALLNLLALFIKKYDLQEKGLETPVSAGELAGELEYWLDDFNKGSGGREIRRVS